MKRSFDIKLTVEDHDGGPSGPQEKWALEVNGVEAFNTLLRPGTSPERALDLLILHHN